MPAVLVQAVGDHALNAASATFPLSIVASSIGSALTAGFFASPAGTRSVNSSPGSSPWVAAVDDGNKRAGWVAAPAATSTSTVTLSNGGVAADFTGFAAEFSGCKPGGLTQSIPRVDGATQNWATDPMTLTQDSLVICVCVNVDSSGATSTTTGVGFTALVGTGITAGVIPNTNEGDVMHVSWGNFANGAIVTGSGSWNAAFNWGAFLYAIELAPTVLTPSLMGHGIFVNA